MRLVKVKFIKFIYWYTASWWISNPPMNTDHEWQVTPRVYVSSDDKRNSLDKCENIDGWNIFNIEGETTNSRSR